VHCRPLSSLHDHRSAALCSCYYASAQRVQMLPDAEMKPRVDDVRACLLDGMHSKCGRRALMLTRSRQEHMPARPGCVLWLHTLTKTIRPVPFLFRQIIAAAAVYSRPTRITSNACCDLSMRVT